MEEVPVESRPSQLHCLSQQLHSLSGLVVLLLTTSAQDGSLPNESYLMKVN